MKNPFTQERRDRAKTYLSNKVPRRYHGYTPITEHESAEVNWGKAMSQSIVALEHAAHFAKKNKSSAEMVEVSTGWLIIADKLQPPGQEPEEEESHDGYSDIGDSDSNNHYYPIGFRGDVAEYEDEEEYDE